MLWTEQLFHIKKPIIAMLHPDALKMLYFINPESARNPDHTPSASVPTPPVRMWMMR